MYKRYTLDEVRRKVIDVMKSTESGLTGVELADRTGINRITITKYLHVMQAMGFVKKKKVGSVNFWFLYGWIPDFEFPINFLQVQQKFMTAILEGNEEQSRSIIASVMSSDVDKIRIITDVIVPTLNTLGELYNRGKIGKTERMFLTNIISDLVSFMNLSTTFEKVTSNMASNAHSIVISSSEYKSFQAKLVSVVLRLMGWSSVYIGNVEEHIDPFFDIDLQRYITKNWNNKNGILVVFIFASEESTLRFLVTALKSLKGRLRANMDIVLFTDPDLSSLHEEIGADVSFHDFASLIKWTKDQYDKLQT